MVWRPRAQADALLLWGRRLWLSVPHPINDDAVEPRYLTWKRLPSLLLPQPPCTGGTRSRKGQGLSQDETARSRGGERNPSIGETGNVSARREMRANENNICLHDDIFCHRCQENSHRMRAVWEGDVAGSSHTLSLVSGRGGIWHWLDGRL